MFNIYYNNGTAVTSTSFFNVVRFLFHALCLSLQNLLYAVRIKCFGLRDKPHMHMHHFLWFLVLGRPMAS